MMIHLTERQEEVLEFIVAFIKDNGYSPSIAEIASFMGVNANASFEVVSAIEKKGYIKRTPYVSRSIVVV